MSRSYSPRAFLRQVPPTLLAAYFHRRQVLTDFTWDQLPDHDIEPIFQAWQALPPDQREAVESEFQDIDEMACDEGIQALIDEATFHQVDLASELAPLEGLHHKALWTYLHHGDLFAVARLMVHADHLPKRFWKRRNQLPRVPPNVSHQGKQQLEAALSAYYRESQGRGHRCTVEIYLRRHRYYYFFAFPDDYTGTYLGHEAGGRLVRRPQRPAFENVFVFDPEDGTLDLYAPGGQQVVTDLQEIFGRVVLGTELGPDNSRRPPFELNGLKARDFAMATDPEDGIAEVRIRKLRLSVMGSGRRLTLEADRDGSREDIHEVIERYLNPQQLPLTLCNVTQATLQFCWFGTGRGRRPTMTFTISYPDSCDLKNHREERRLVAEKYLKRWGIDRA